MLQYHQLCAIRIVIAPFVRTHAFGFVCAIAGFSSDKGVSPLFLSLAVSGFWYDDPSMRVKGRYGDARGV